MDASFWNNRLVKNLGGRNGLMVFTEGFRRAYSKRFHISVANIAVLPMPLDLARFRPDRSYVDQRPVYDIPADSPVIGIVARFQKYRRMDVFMEAARKLVDMRPNVQFMVIGRSGQMQETVINPMEKLGLKKHVVTPGYLIDNYLDVLQTLNVFTLMMPGFDGTARALREAMAVGKPCVASNFGMLPDIVQHNETGMIFELTDADALAQCWLRLIDDSALAKKMGDCAAAYAHRHFRIDLVGSTLEKFYKTLANNK